MGALLTEHPRKPLEIYVRIKDAKLTENGKHVLYDKICGVATLETEPDGTRHVWVHNLTTGGILEATEFRVVPEQNTLTVDEYKVRVPGQRLV